ncbi:MAG: hypothetical protein QG651_570 [Pseudomonadota bacterium]|jgi:glycosyltransferase involved in cell wall biosynthesis|nr:hypothetical protein [Pseudomonadota bacterium]
MKKVVIVGSNSIHCQRYIAGVIATGEFDVSLISNQKMSEFANLNCLEVNFALRNFNAVKQIRAYLKSIQADVVHIHQANSYAWHTLRALRKLTRRPKVVLTTWGSDVLILPKQSKLMRRMVEYNLRHSDLITSDSLFMSAQIAALLGKVSRPIHTLNFGMQNLPALIDVTSKHKIILSNRLHKPLYRVDKIIQAFATLIKNNLIDTEYRLVIAGSGDESANLEQLAQDLSVKSRIDFVGMLSYRELVEFYQQAQLFISVPESDGTSSSLLEALAYGCIPVLSNLPANLEWVLDQVNGFIAPEVGQLQQQILAAIQFSQNIVEYQKLANFNHQMILGKASFSRNIRKFTELY